MATNPSFIENGCGVNTVRGIITDSKTNRMPSFWIPALKEYNAAAGTWCVPKKGTPAHAEVKAIMDRMKEEAAAPKPRRKLRTAAMREQAAMAMEDRDAPAPKSRRKLHKEEAKEEEHEYPDTHAEEAQYYKYSRKEDSEGAYALYEKVGNKFKSVYGYTRQTVRPNPEVPSYKRLRETYKRNTTGTIRRKLERIPGTDEYYARATTGELRGEIVERLVPYEPDTREMRFIKGEDPTLVIDSAIDTERDERKESEKKRKQSSKELRVRIDQAIENDAEMKQLEDQIDELYSQLRNKDREYGERKKNPFLTKEQKKAIDNDIEASYYDYKKQIQRVQNKQDKRKKQIRDQFKEEMERIKAK